MAGALINASWQILAQLSNPFKTKTPCSFGNAALHRKLVSPFPNLMDLNINFTELILSTLLRSFDNDLVLMHSSYKVSVPSRMGSIQVCF